MTPLAHARDIYGRALAAYHCPRLACAIARQEFFRALRQALPRLSDLAFDALLGAPIGYFAAHWIVAWISGSFEVLR